MANISFVSQRLLNKIFVQSGYVLDFSNNMFAEFFETEVGVDIYDERYAAQGTSKGNRLRTFLRIEDGPTVARALQALWNYRCTMVPADEGAVDYGPQIQDLIRELLPSDSNQAASPTPVATLPASAGPISADNSALGTITALASYAHNDATYNAHVLAVVQRLRSDGIECWSDHFVPFPKEGWPAWMQREVAKRRWILVFVSESYKRRAEGTEQPGHGLGVIWEHGMIRSELYAGGKINERFLPVGFGPSQRHYVPDTLRDYTYFDLNSATDYQKLLSVLREEPFIAPAPLGKYCPTNY